MRVIPNPNKNTEERVSCCLLKVLAILWDFLCQECVSRQKRAPDPTEGAYSTSPDPVAGN